MGRERAEAWGTMVAKMAGSNGGRDGSGARAGGSTPFIDKGGGERVLGVQHVIWGRALWPGDMEAR